MTSTKILNAGTHLTNNEKTQFTTDAIRAITSGPEHLIIDASRIEELTLPGVAALIGACKEASALNIRTTLVMPQSEEARRFLDMTRIDMLFSTVNTMEDALPETRYVFGTSQLVPVPAF